MKRPRPSNLLVDPRVGSAHLAPILRRSGLPASIRKLQFGDVAWVGSGPDDCPAPCACEVKTISDMLQSFTSGRFVGTQLPGLLSSCTYAWLILEGLWRQGPSGEIQVGTFRERRMIFSSAHSRLTYRDLDTFLCTLEIICGLRVRRTADRLETAQVIADLYRWWQKPWDAHRAHRGFDWSGALAEARATTIPFRPASRAQQFAALLPGVGWAASQAAVRKFGSIQAMAGAGALHGSAIDFQRAWASLRVGRRRLGDKTALRIIDALSIRG